ncbi:BTAD domain-containing putative transcriptional regulator [Actinophytocola sp. NPDC049390]|uniref:AfsR/SARP family transcriptional regulator n=1 Tax=Actinophytocola sp. NPDC049390 TaxID=3363894 RepID=UPI0037A29F88
MALSFGLLGDLEVRTGSVLVPVGPPRQQNVLTCLLVDANQVVPADRIVERVWGHRPAGDHEAVYPYVSRLRRVLGREGDARIRRRDGGYVLEVDPADVDLHRFRALVETARNVVTAGRRLALLEQACGLWRGEPLSRLDSPWAATARDQLRDELLSVTLERLDLAVAHGGCAELVGELAELVERYPLVERVTGLLMRALHGAGRRADALDRFHRLRAVLATELGIDPSAELHRIHQAVLRDEAPPTGLATAAPCSLPYAMRDFVGRAADVAAVVDVAEIAADRQGVAICAISGMPGVGKTTLAVHAAHRVANRFPGGRLYLDLQGHNPRGTPLDTVTALGDLLRMVGVPAQEIPDGAAMRATRWRTTTAGLDLLLVLDDAVSAEQVRALLPGAPGTLVLVTSRRRLVGLEVTTALDLDTLRPAEAVRLFTSVVGDRATREPVAVADVVELCGHLPLAVRIAAARLVHRPSWTIQDLVSRLRSEERGLGELSTDDRGVASAFALSYRDVAEHDRRVFRLLGLNPGTDFDRYAAAALCDLPVAEAEAALENLLDANLLVQRVTGRYRFHDLVRRFAMATGTDEEPAPERAAAIGRLRDYYLATAAAAMRTVEPTEQRIEPAVDPVPAMPALSAEGVAERWLAVERPNLVHVVLSATGRHSWQLPHLVRDFFYLHSHYDDWLNTHSHALAVARAAGDRRAEAVTSVGIGFAYYRAGRLVDAQAAYERAIELREVLEPAQLATALNNLGLLHRSRGNHRTAMPLHRRARELYRSTGHHGGEAYALYAFGLSVARLGHLEVAAELLEDALELTRRSGRRYGEAIVLGELGIVRCTLGDHDEAATYLAESLALSRAVGLRYSEITALRGLGVLATAQGRHTEAISTFRDALHRAEAINERSHQCVLHNCLGGAHLALGDRARATDHYGRALALSEAVGLPGDHDRAVAGLTASDAP